MAHIETLDGIRHIHLIGIGGIGVSALAPMLAHQGYLVTGSDPARNEVTDRLRAQGIGVFHTHEAGNVEGADLIVYSSAIKPDNPEIIAAHEKHIPLWHRARMLGYLMQRQRGIVVSGAHGKTTVTSMITKLLLDTGFDPTAFIGGDLPFIGGNSRIGKGEWVIAEGDESDGSFVHLKPEIAIVNNIDADHLDFYENMDAIQQSFHRFLENVPPQGWIVGSADSAQVSDVIQDFSVQKLTYGFHESAELRALDYHADSAGLRCDVELRGKPLGRLSLQVSGRSNCHNALAAVAVGQILEIPFPEVKNSLYTFSGVHRRMEWKGQAKGITVLDDYAHHPTEIRAPSRHFETVSRTA
jgi:UDP-N-acetylmuramate--alanine ligase